MFKPLEQATYNELVDGMLVLKKSKRAEEAWFLGTHVRLVHPQFINIYTFVCLTDSNRGFIKNWVDVHSAVKSLKETPNLELFVTDNLKEVPFDQ